MKQIIYSCLLLCFAFNVFAQEQFTIKGQLKDPRFEGKGIIIYKGKEKIRSLVKDGIFTLSGSVDQPTYVSLHLDQDSIMQVAIKTGDTSKIVYPGSIMLFLEKGHINVKGHNFNDAVVRGTKTNDEYLQFKRKVGRQLAKRKLNSETDKKNLQDSLSLVYIEQNPASIALVPLILDINTTYFVANNLDRVAAASNQLTAPMSQRYAAILLSEVKRIKNFGIGSIAPDFTLKSDKDEDVSLSDYKGKYVLIEFWAHYCNPCIKEVPFMKEAFSAYKDKNFSILQISVDKAEHQDRWLKAVKLHTSDWDNVIDYEDVTKAAKTKYGVFGIPANFLIDPKGKIVAVDLKGDNLKNTLKTLLK